LRKKKEAIVKRCPKGNFRRKKRNLQKTEGPTLCVGKKNSSFKAKRGGEGRGELLSRNKEGEKKKKKQEGGHY